MRPRTRRVTLRDVAAVVSVDPSAVSRVVNNDPRVSVSEATRKRILDIVERSSATGQTWVRVACSDQRPGRLVLFCRASDNPMYEPIARGVEIEADERGYCIVLGSQIPGRSPKTFAALLQEGRVEGLLVASSTLHDDLHKGDRRAGPGPVVLVNRRVDGITSGVAVDDEGASRKAVNYLNGLGHQNRRTAFSGRRKSDTSVRRKKGFSNAVRGAGLSSVEVDRPGWTAEHGYLATHQILTDNPQVTAIYAHRPC